MKALGWVEERTVTGVRAKLCSRNQVLTINCISFSFLPFLFLDTNQLFYGSYRINYYRLIIYYTRGRNVNFHPVFYVELPSFTDGLFMTAISERRSSRPWQYNQDYKIKQLMYRHLFVFLFYMRTGINYSNQPMRYRSIERRSIMPLSFWYLLTG